MEVIDRLIRLMRLIRMVKLDLQWRGRLHSYMWMDGMGLGWMDGIIIIGRRQSKSTFCANKGNILSVRRIGAELFSVAVS